MTLFAPEGGGATLLELLPVRKNLRFEEGSGRGSDHSCWTWLTHARSKDEPIGHRHEP